MQWKKIDTYETIKADIIARNEAYQAKVCEEPSIKALIEVANQENKTMSDNYSEKNLKDLVDVWDKVKVTKYSAGKNTIDAKWHNDKFSQEATIRNSEKSGYIHAYSQTNFKDGRKEVRSHDCKN